MRKSFSKFQQTEILGNQDYKCRLCHTRFAKNVHPQFDHIDGDHTDNRTENGQVICSNCHDAKSRKENVKRSVKEKNINFVKCCPLCGNKLKAKDYQDSDTGKRYTTDYLAADDWITCGDCESTFKIIRKDPKAGERKLSGKKVDDAVKYCTYCRQEYEPLKSNSYIKCEKCNTIFAVWIKEYKKKGFWS